MSSTEQAAGKLDISRVVGGTGRVLRDDVPAWVALALVAYGLPYLLITWLQIRLTMDGNANATLWMVLPTILLGALFSGLVVRKTAAADAGQRVSVFESAGAALRALFPLLSACLLALLGSYAGMILLIVPGIMLACRWAVVAPVTVTDRIGPLAAMKRSAQLTKDNRWPVFGAFVLYYVLAALAGLVVSFATRGPSMFSNSYAEMPMIWLIASAIVSSLIILAGAVGTTVIYLELRRLRGSGEDLAEVFA